MSAAPPMPGTEGNDWQTALWRELCAAPARACGPLIAQYSQKPVHLTSAGRRNPCMCTALQLSAAFQQPKGALSYAGVCMHWVTGTLYLLRGSSTCELRSCAAALPCACVTSLPQMGHACEREHHDPCGQALCQPPAQCLPALGVARLACRCSRMRRPPGTASAEWQASAEQRRRPC